MKIFETSRDQSEFRVLGGTTRCQAAMMTLQPNTATGGAENRHEQADQCLYVISGKGQAIVEGQHVALTPGAVLIVEAGEAHEIRCLGDDPLVTVNVYAPPEY